MVRTPTIALQLWSVRELIAHDLEATLMAVRAIGYEAVELAGLAGHTPAQWQAALTATGLRVVGAHVPLDQLTDARNRVIDDLRTIGCPRVVLPWIPPVWRTSLKTARELAATMDGIAYEFRAQGIAFAYHHEDYDFQQLTDPGINMTLWQTLVDATSPAWVQLQLDLVSAQLAGMDLRALVQQSAGRAVSLHLCDLRAGRYAVIGTGEIDWGDVLGAAAATGIGELVIEHDAPPRPLVDVAASLRGLRSMLAGIAGY